MSKLILQNIFTTIGPIAARIKEYCDSGDATYTCSHCQAKYCEGKVQLPFLHDAPQLLQQLMDYNGGELSKLFQKKIKVVNAMFSFTSTGGKINREINNGHGPYIFHLNGHNHHRIGTLLPTYVDGCPREYNLPTTYEVAALVSGDGNPTECRDVIVEEHHTDDGHNPVKRISELHLIFMALQYPLLFPYGEDGFQLEIPLNDAMAICRWAGPPNLFVTMTCNPKWFEIKRDVENYIPGQPTADRPDTITCVFMKKLDDLMEDIQMGHHFGRVKADDKISSTDEIDHVIFAELPSEVDDLIGFKAVCTHMMHGPCGDQFRSSPYMSRNGCTKGYPKEYCEETFIICDGWPRYKRSNNGRRAKVGQRDTMLDNRFVIPHNINLIVKYDCHINVEWCNQGSMVKYLFNYLNKGPDHATFVIEGQTNHNNYNNNSRTPYRSILHHADEIEQYLNYRYISACEACWKLLSFELHYRSIAVERLAFHEEGCNRVYFRDDDDVENVFKRATNAMSKFTGWMRAKEIYPEGRHLLYADYPTEFTWHASDKEWRPRKSGMSIGHIYYVHLSMGEIYYLRMLLNHVPGATSHTFIRTVDRIIYPTYMSACKALNLLGDDIEWIRSIREADTFPYISEDITRKHRRNRLIATEKMYNMDEEWARFTTLYGGLNSEKRVVYDNIMLAVNENNGRLFFVYGSGEESTLPYTSQTKEHYNGRWICGMCMEAV
nr:hypothetical protein [Tanacetum cinerariifolium]